MSDILINGMEMPRLGYREIRIHPDGRITENDEGYEETIGTAIPVPDHGRLGDLDRLAEKIHECWDAYPADAFCEDFLDEMPTIIPADKESGK